MLELTWYGTAGLVIKSEQAEIAFDPFLGFTCQKSRNSGKGLTKEGVCLHADPAQRDEQLTCAGSYRKIKHIFVTHGHFDHIYHIPSLYKGSEATIYCTKTPAKTLQRRGMSEKAICRIEPGTKVKVGDLTVKAYQGRHCRFDGKLVFHTLFKQETRRHLLRFLRLIFMNFRYRGKKEILFYEVTDGEKRIQVMGSMNLDAATVYPTGADELVLPLQGRSDLSTYPLHLIERLKPKTIVLDHCDNTFSPLTGKVDTDSFRRAEEKTFGIPCRVLEYGEAYMI